MLYTRTATARWYVHDGEKDFIAFDFTDGTMQGDVSGPMCYALGTVEVNRRFPNRLVQVADDVYHVGENALDEAASVIDAFKEVGQNLQGPKMKVILPAGKRKEDYPQLSTPLFENATIVSAPTEVVGGIVTPNQSSSYADLKLAAAPKVLRRLQSRIDKILSLDTSVQCRILCLRRLVWTMVYYAQTTLNPHAEELFREADAIIMKALKQVLPFIEPDIHTSTLSRTIEDGGVGFMQLADVFQDLQNSLAEVSRSYLEYFGLPTSDAIQASDKPLRYIWRTKSGTAKNAYNRDGRTFTRSDFNSWLECRPSTKLTRIEDDVYLHQMKILLECIHPFKGRCQDPQCTDPDFLKWDSKRFTHHSLTCAACTKAMMWLRHEAVVDAMRSTNKFYGLSTHIPRANEWPRPGNRKGGPDIMVFGTGSDAVDVTITTVKNFTSGERFKSQLKEAFDEKMRKYKEFHALTQYRIVPYVVSHLGVVAKETRELMSEWKNTAADPQYLYDLYNHTQIAIIRTQWKMFEYFCNVNDKNVLESVDCYGDEENGQGTE